jgi:hypothetical protein
MKIGDRVKIISHNDKGNHYFKIGDIGAITEIDEKAKYQNEQSFRVRVGNLVQWLFEDELELMPEGIITELQIAKQNCQKTTTRALRKVLDDPRSTFGECCDVVEAAFCHHLPCADEWLNDLTDAYPDMKAAIHNLKLS